MKSGDSLVFFGTGPVAAKSLELLSKRFVIEAVVTKPKPAHHKGAYPVLDVANKLKLPVKAVINKHELSQLIAGNPFSSRVGVLVDFGIIVSQDVIDYFPLGIVNSHFSILPEWRGADPITFAILSGQKVTGVSLMLLVEAMDEGPLLAYGEYELPLDITTPLLSEHLINFSDALLGEILPDYLSGKVTTAVDQSVTGRSISYSRKLTKQDGMLDWEKPAEVLEREIRAYIGWPGSQTTLAGKPVIVTKAHLSDKTGKIGKISVENKQLQIFCETGSLIIDRLKPAGKQEMTATEFISGYGKEL